MTMKKLFVLCLSHLSIAFIGFALGIYSLPLLMAPPAPSQDLIFEKSKGAVFQAEFQRNLKGNDWLHWGEGKLSLSQKYIAFSGELAPGPDYKLYLSPIFVEDESTFNAAKSQMLAVGEINTFHNFIVALPDHTNLNKFNTVVVWCESFGEFIAAAKYQ